MKRASDTYYMDLLNNGNNLHYDYASQPPTLLDHLSIPNEEIDVSLSQSQLGSSSRIKFKRPRNGKFTPQEDLLLISAWLNISIDPIIGNDQKHQTYWERIHAYFEAHKDFTSKRSPNSLLQRWSVMQLTVSKFEGCFSQIESRNRSGTTEEDKISEALQLFKSLHNNTFSFLHCWNELRHTPKFSSVMTRKKTNTSKTGSLNSTIPSIDAGDVVLEETDNSKEEDGFERPIGRKAAKECATLKKVKRAKEEDDTKEILVEIRDSQKVQREERKAFIAEFLKIEKERVEREKLKEEREKMLYEQKVLATDMTNMDQFEAVYFTSLKEAIIEKRRITGFSL